jgi:hypothetical protein
VFPKEIRSSYLRNISKRLYRSSRLYGEWLYRYSSGLLKGTVPERVWITGGRPQGIRVVFHVGQQRYINTNPVDTTQAYILKYYLTTGHTAIKLAKNTVLLNVSPCSQEVSNVRRAFRPPNSTSALKILPKLRHFSTGLNGVGEEECI